MKRKNGEGTWGTKTIKGHTYTFYRDSKGKYYYGKSDKEIMKKVELQRRTDSVAKSINDVHAKLSTTFYNYVVAYIENIKMTLQPYTYYNYTHMVDNLLKNTKLAKRQLHQLTPDMFTAYYSELAVKYSYGTILSIHKILKGPLKAAEYDGLVRPHTSSKIRIPKERYCKPVEDLYVPTVNDMIRIEEECFKKNTKGNYKLRNNGLAFVVIMHTGLRIGELIALRWNDIDMKKRKIDVNKSASFRVIDGKQVYEDKDPKSQAGFRVIPFDDTVYNIFVFLKENYPASLNEKTGFVFTNKNLRHLDKSTMEQTLKKHIAEPFNMGRLTPHTLRHAYSSYLASQKVNPKVVAKLMGHEKPDITYDVYVESYEEDMIEAANLFNLKNKEE